MNKVVLMGVIAVLSTSVTARAADSRDHEHRLFRFDFSCSFQEEAQSALETPAAPEKERCTADARIFAYVRHDDDSMASIEMARDRLNLLAVSCHGELIYADTAVLESRKRVVEIEAPNGVPAIFVIRKDDDHITPDVMRYEAFLQLRGEERLKGHCDVKSRPVHGDELN